MTYVVGLENGKFEIELHVLQGCHVAIFPSCQMNDNNAALTGITTGISALFVEYTYIQRL